MQKKRFFLVLGLFIMIGILPCWAVTPKDTYIKKLDNDEIKSIGESYENLKVVTEKLWKLVGKPITTNGITTYQGTKLSGTYNQFLTHGIVMQATGDFAPQKIVDEYNEEVRVLSSAGVIAIIEEVKKKGEILNKIIADIQTKKNISIDRPEEVYEIYKKKFKQ